MKVPADVACKINETPPRQCANHRLVDDLKDGGDSKAGDLVNGILKFDFIVSLVHVDSEQMFCNRQYTVSPPYNRLTQTKWKHPLKTEWWMKCFFKKEMTTQYGVLFLTRRLKLQADMIFPLQHRDGLVDRRTETTSQPIPRSNTGSGHYICHSLTISRLKLKVVLLTTTIDLKRNILFQPCYHMKLMFW